MTKSGTGTWDLESEDLGRRNVGLEDAGKWNSGPRDSKTDDVIGCSSTVVVRHKIKNISANNEAMLIETWQPRYQGLFSDALPPRQGKGPRNEVGNLAGMLHPMKYTRWYTF